MSADTLFSKMVLKSSIRPSGREQLKSDAELKEAAIAASREGGKEGVKAVAKEEAKKEPVARLSRKERKAARNAPAKTDSVPPRKQVDVVAKDSTAAVKPVLVTDTKKAVLDSVKTKPGEKKVIKGKNNKPAAKIVKPVKSTNPADTVKKRVVMAYHRAKIFKNDLQAKADSMFFSYGDSIMRCYVNPMIWTQGSQLSGDTIYLQLKNKKLDNMLLQHNSFIVNTEEGDSTHFNQVRGKVITGVFEKGKLDRMFVDGNAESIYYVKEDSAYSGMNRMLSSRIKVLFKDSKLNNIISILKPEGNFYPMDKIPADEAILKGFIWKPKERPRSKAEITPALGGKQLPKGKTPAKKPAVKKVAVKPVTTAKKSN